MIKVSASECDKYQFGFKAGHSTSMCADTVKKVINYYSAKSSHVFACFVDLSKAFDWKLFNKLLSDGVDIHQVKLLAYWYVNQEASVRWLNTKSESFHVGNDGYQGGGWYFITLSFTRYIVDLITNVGLSNTSCRIGNMPTNIFAYADDIFLLTPSWYAMQALLKVLEKQCVLLDLCCNIKKTVCMVFNLKDKSKVVCDNFSRFTMDSKLIEFVS